MIIGGIINAEGKMESHGRWLPYPILVPMMVGTAMSIEKDYYSADTALKLVDYPKRPWMGIMVPKKEFVPFIGLPIKLARKMNLFKWLSLLKVVQTLQGVFDLAALIRMLNRPLSSAIGKIKEANRKVGFLANGSKEKSQGKILEMIEDKKVIQSEFDYNLQIIYSATLLSPAIPLVF